ncbi:MAG: hypothetical protein M1834_004520 [Cirrosporium novae-zelandiae]|nr:MAG: hypothetical protein M1834_004520 [Cirrosporium novae-zelandiae]
MGFPSLSSASTRLMVFTVVFSLPASASFSLDTSGEDWDYTTADLLDTTSQACKDAYSATINCDYTLVGLVASMRSAFSPSSSDLANTCTDTCKASLDAWVANVTSACSEKGDKAQESLGGRSNELTTDPIQLVGQIFQYEFAKDCAVDSDGLYCYNKDKSYGSTDFSCNDKCSMNFYTVAHEYKASSWEFNYYYLIARSEWWITQFKGGWQTVEKCGGIATLTSSTAQATKTVFSSIISSSDISSAATGTSQLNSHMNSTSTVTGTSNVIASTGMPSLTLASASASSSGTGESSSSQLVTKMIFLTFSCLTGLLALI